MTETPRSSLDHCMLPLPPSIFLTPFPTHYFITVSPFPPRTRVSIPNLPHQDFSKNYVSRYPLPSSLHALTVSIHPLHPLHLSGIYRFRSLPFRISHTLLHWLLPPCTPHLSQMQTSGTSSPLFCWLLHLNLASTFHCKNVCRIILFLQSCLLQYLFFPCFINPQLWNTLHSTYPSVP